MKQYSATNTAADVLAKRFDALPKDGLWCVQLPTSDWGDGMLLQVKEQRRLVKADLGANSQAQCEHTWFRDIDVIAWNSIA